MADQHARRAICRYDFELAWAEAAMLFRAFRSREEQCVSQAEPGDPLFRTADKLI
jgi:hypothetical protein